jgi:hypothetical protein
MERLAVSYATGEFEVPAEFDEERRITRECALRLSRIIDNAGFVIVV